MTMKQTNSGFARLRYSIRYSCYGLKAGWLHEESFRLEAILCIVLFPFSFWLAESLMQWLVLIFCMLQLLIVELLNSAVEATVDRISEEHHPLSGRAKDFGAAAVMLSTILALLPWLAFLVHRLFW